MNKQANRNGSTFMEYGVLLVLLLVVGVNSRGFLAPFYNALYGVAQTPIEAARNAQASAPRSN